MPPLPPTTDGSPPADTRRTAFLDRLVDKLDQLTALVSEEGANGEEHSDQEVANVALQISRDLANAANALLADETDIVSARAARMTQRQTKVFNPAATIAKSNVAWPADFSKHVAEKKRRAAAGARPAQDLLRSADMSLEIAKRSPPKPARGRH